MRYKLLGMLLVVIGCGEADSPTSPPPSSPARHYQLTSLFHEDIIPGQYHITALSETFAGGPVSWDFRDNGTGSLVVTATLSVLFVDSLSGASQRNAILTVGEHPFKYTLDSQGIAAFSQPSPWPFGLPTVVTDTAVNQRVYTCYDETCGNRFVIITRWARIS